MLRYGEVKQEPELGVVLLFKHDSLLKGAAIVHNVHCHGVNDVADALIRWKMDLNIWVCSKTDIICLLMACYQSNTLRRQSAQSMLYEHDVSDFAAVCNLGALLIASHLCEGH